MRNNTCYVLYSRELPNTKGLCFPLLSTLSLIAVTVGSGCSRSSATVYARTRIFAMGQGVAEGLAEEAGVNGVVVVSFVVFFEYF